MTTCIVDTSTLVELLNVPGLASKHADMVREFAVRVGANESLLLPLAVLFETGNHIAQVKNGGARRSAAVDFVVFARKALAGELPFATTPFPQKDDVASWLDDFPDHASREVGLADRSLIAL